ncbi:mechanosensitive ion channel family protein [Marinomonas mediterranea]|jgi:Small-conductance mechanosensitive channel|uniref:MscS Mechanosensitive ion channel n=1 Tax=Marinomonas mediterranea (strain ATCC 700492 / JCM 21426 / NBRC 103028 / MMB-1) TaxID=717774 RepID=F2JT83_MARM1|nr:mechanosensitive ion channel family protein [Marinomonas mediterranea]ADZ90301.1 MscS Mechanosensitive ion channel [Marinomonas mediterranea MMB-1]WCN08361.1 mechanosensitive ion channel [Marinomonas mediterranea]WCN16491.1 mechanosensitive ion channel [Marinomonas mediterranea MMB-1]
MNWQDLQAYLGLGNTQMHWAIQLCIVSFTTFLTSYIVKRTLKRLELQLSKTKTPWDHILIKAARRPLIAFIWLIGLIIIAEIFRTKFDDRIHDIISLCREVGIIALMSWFLWRCIKGVEHILTSPDKVKKTVDITTASAVSKLLRASVVIIGILIVMQSLGYSMSGVLAFGGVGGIAVGFAAKDLLANFFGGLMIYLDRPFAVGDWVRSPDQDIEGTVENIGWRQTRIRTFDKRPLYVPNATFSTISVENPSRMTNRRIKETIGVRYDDADKLSTIVDKIKQMIEAHPELDTNQIYMVNFNQFGPSSLDFFIYTFTKTVDWRTYHKVKQDVLFKVMDIITNEGAEIAFPTQTLHIQKDSE